MTTFTATANYRISVEATSEAQSSSGVIITTGTGGTGWARSIHRQRKRPCALPGAQDPTLAFFVREPFPSIATATSVEQGLLPAGQEMEIVSEMNEDGTVFADGVEPDRLEFSWGMRLKVTVAQQQLHLVVG